MSKLRETLDAGGFAVVAELQPPRGTDAAEMLAPVKALRDRVTAFGVPDNRHARLGLAALAAARLVQEVGGEPVLHMSCRDRNRLALESDLLGAAALGVENLLLVSGDYVTLGDHPQAKPVYDADSVQLLQIARDLEQGRDSVGQPLAGSPTFFPGAVAVPEADPLDPQLLKCDKKIAADARFLVTPPVFDPEKLRPLRERLAGTGVRLLAGIGVLDADEVAQAVAGAWRKVYTAPPALLEELVGLEPEALLARGAAAAGRLAARLKNEKLADGVYLKARGRADLLTAILEAGGR